MAALVRKPIFRNRLAYIHQSTGKGNGVWVKQLRNPLELNVGLFLKEYCNHFTFESTSDDMITDVIHKDTKWLKMK